MTDLTPEQCAQIDYLRAFNPGRGSRWIAEQVGGISYSTVLRYLAEQRNGDGDAPASEDELAVVHQIAASQPSAAAVAVAGTGTTQVAEAQAPAQEQPWLQRHVTPDEQLALDVRQLRDLVAEHEPIGVGVLRDLFTDGSDSRDLRERFNVAFSHVQTSDTLIQTAEGVRLTKRGRWLIEQDKEPAPAKQPDFAGLRLAYVNSLPERRRVLQQQARALEQQRSERFREHERALTRFISTGTLYGLPGWHVDAERDLAADNVLALYPPQFVNDLGDRADIYLRVAVDEQQKVCWLRASRGGPLVFIGEGWPSEAVRAAILQAWVPVVDPSAPRLPEMVDVQEAQRG